MEISHEGLLDTVHRSPPPRLMRFELSQVCNFKCRFCCWEKPVAKAPLRRFDTQHLQFFGEMLVASGCRNFCITGGEPLLLPLDYLCGAITALSGVQGRDEIWVATNGVGFQNEELCRRLYAAGLRDAAVSIAAETDEKYQRYTGGSTTLSMTLGAVRRALDHGIRVRTHVALNPLGVSRGEELLTLVDRLRAAGVDSLYYFGLHKSAANSGSFDSLYVAPGPITDELQANPSWHLRRTAQGRPFFSDGDFRIMVPRASVSLVTDSCLQMGCGSFCQGVYAAYTRLTAQGWAVRACDRVFVDERNLFRIRPEWLERRDRSAALRFLRSVWWYAYERSSGESVPGG